MTLSQTYQEWKEATKREGRQEGRQEGKLESIPRLLALGLSVEQIAQALDLDLEQVRQVIQETQ
jgi:predicted transposase/invertase (TIGR01784 family)